MHVQKSVSQSYRGYLLMGRVWNDRLTSDVLLISLGAGVLATATIMVIVGAITFNDGGLALVIQPALVVAGLIGAFDALVVAALGLAFNGWER